MYSLLLSFLFTVVCVVAGAPMNDSTTTDVANETIVFSEVELKPLDSEFVNESSKLSSMNKTSSADIPMDLTDHVTSTEETGIDEHGCDRSLKRKYESKCDTAYDHISNNNQEIQDDAERTEAMCCSLEDYEKCSLQALDRANCKLHKAQLRENLKATRLIMNVFSNITCSAYRGKCDVYPSSADSLHSMSWYLASVLIVLPLIF